MTNRLMLIAALTVVATATPAHAQAPAADTILMNGKVITLDDASSIVEAIAIHDGKVLAVGSSEDIRKRVEDSVLREIGPIARPRRVVIVPDMPKTRSGKIMRRVLGAISNNEDAGDISTLANPEIVDEIRKMKF